MAGTISAKGGSQGGNGGFAEVSGDNGLTISGSIDLSAPLGQVGTVLLDPGDLYISDNMPTTPPITSTVTPPTGFLVVTPTLTASTPDTTTPAWVSPATLVGFNANIDLAATNNIFVMASTPTGTNNRLNLSTNTLALTAGQSLNIDRGFTISAASITLTATAGQVVLGANKGTAAGTNTSGALAAATSLQAPSIKMATGTGIVLGDGVLGTVGTPVATVTMNATGGGVSQTAAGAINATTLQTTTGVSGNVTLIGSGNAIANVTGIAAAGGTSTGGDTVLITNTGSLTLTGTYAGNNLFFENAKSGGSLQIGTNTIGATLTAAASGRISLVSDTVTEGTAASTIVATGGTVEIGPFTTATPVPVSLNGTPSAGTLTVDPTLIADIVTGTGTLLVGGYTNVPTGATAPAATAASLSVDGGLTLNVGKTGDTLALLANGQVGQTGTLGVGVGGTLIGNAGTVSLTNGGNAIGTLGAFSTTAGFALVDNTPLTVSGPVKDTGAASTLALTTKTGGITLAGTVSAINIVDLVSAGAINQTSGTLIAGVLTGSAATSASLAQPTNLVGTLDAFTTAAGFALTDNQPLLVTGPVKDTGAASTLALTTKTGDITLAGTVSAINIVDLISAGAISQTSGTLMAGTLTGSAVGDISLLGNSNSIVTSTGISATGGDVNLVDNAPTLTLTGTYAGNDLFFELAHANGTLAIGTNAIGAALTAAASGRISLVSDTITEGTAASTIVATGGTVEIGPFTTATPVPMSLNGTPSAGTLTVDPTLIADIVTGTGTLLVGGFTNVPTGATAPAATAASLSVDGGLTFNVGKTGDTLALLAKGQVGQTGTLGVGVGGTLIGNAGTVSLTNVGNAIGTLGAFSTTAGFALVDNTPLTVTGPVKDTGAASTLALTTKTGGITLAGTVSAINIMDLVSAGAINQTSGTLIAGTLTGSAATSASLAQPTNLVGTLDAFTTAAGFALTDNQPLLVTGPVIDTGAASTLALTTKTGDITLAGTVSATNIVDLISAGAISQTERHADGRDADRQRGDLRRPDTGVEPGRHAGRVQHHGGICAHRQPAAAGNRTGEGHRGGEHAGADHQDR